MRVAMTFRQRIFAWLVTIAAVPALIAVAATFFAPEVAAPVGGADAWERAAESFRAARRGLDLRSLPPSARSALEAHGEELATSVMLARRAQAIRAAFSGILAAVAIALAVLVAGGAVRLAGHLSRQLSRPIDELVDWTTLIERGEPLPDGPPPKGAPEFEVLRTAFRRMASELDRARAREVEAAGLRAFQELARQVAHELKNPLTPIRFAIDRLRKETTPEQREQLLEILSEESGRIEQMAREFADLGRLPEGPAAPIDVVELLQTLARGAPEDVKVRVETRGTPVVLGHVEPLRRALSNLVLNAIDALRSTDTEPARAQAEIVLEAQVTGDGRQQVLIAVRDNGPGIPPENLSRVFEPYFTTKTRGTGLGLAIVRQTVHHHGGTIEVASEPGRGTTFTLTLPAFVV